ncbi:hypothetical protein TNCV_1664421 [Trichonephila clavipes]|uniref:Tc1-like transposase DDE domain-containing protein n=1 Tax=Trichonephila clavipes TaxID=2585209 RepID=A0A8X6RWF4_TRICX|nr:hypothetical protein TNCV_1664421 [Trichonephila clavipes]
MTSTHSCPLCILTDLGKFSRTMQPTTHPELLQSGSSSEFRHFRWPPKSSDMNIIEHISNAFHRVVQKKSPPLLNPTDL